MSDSPDVLINHSTRSGKFHIIVHRCRETCKSIWITAAIISLVVLVGVLNATMNSTSEEKSNELNFTELLTASNLVESEKRTRFEFTTGRLIYGPKYVTDTHWNEHATFPTPEDFQYLAVDPLTILEVEINSALLDASIFSGYIQNFYNLRSLKLKNITIVGQFSRVYLPKLEKFYLEQTISSNEKLTDYKERERLKSLLFFEKSATQSWSLTKDFATLGIDLEVFIDGSKVLVASKTKSEITLTMSYCNDFLNNIPWPYDNLVLGNCSVSKRNIPTNIKSLLMGNVEITDGNLEDVLKSMTRIQSFSGSIPDVSIQISNLPSSLTFLCLTGIRLEYDEDRKLSSSSSTKLSTTIKQVAFGGDNLASSVVSQFDKIFPELEIIGIFGMGNKSYQLLHNVLKTKAQQIIVEFFPRESHPEAPAAQAVEEYLEKIGVETKYKNFILRTVEDDPENRIGGEISESESYFYRFTMLGWSKIDTFQKFLRVIAQGKVKEDSVQIAKKNGTDGVGGEKVVA
ncbi:hypothetical protein Ocin01_08544 [Orchesella cincta]|uniref:Uncharacterized protein n=1 Tax=Orchesella cincta TaxID=48709 RepID=A0A1D2MYH8_ORCCI|nr:hypothetical protein Ocin01_08544 [Orchesella cincta]